MRTYDTFPEGNGRKGPLISRPGGGGVAVQAPAGNVRRGPVDPGHVGAIAMQDPEGNEFCVLRALSPIELARVPYGD